MNHLLNTVDAFLNSITMYRLVLFGLATLALIAIVLGFLGYAPFGGIELTVLFVTIVAVCYLTNRPIAYVLKAPINPESSLITGLILFFILFPPSTTEDFGVVVVAGILAMASKYIFAIGKRHIFNPVAVSLVILILFGRGEGVWWVGSLSLLPFVAILGLLIVRKIRKMELFGIFLAVSMGTGFIAGYLDGGQQGRYLIHLLYRDHLSFLVPSCLRSHLQHQERESFRLSTLHSSDSLLPFRIQLVRFLSHQKLHSS